MISKAEIDYTALSDEGLQTQHYGRTVLAKHYLDSLPKTESGRVDINQLSCESGTNLISPQTRFQRLVDIEVALGQIREELGRRGLEPEIPEA